MSSNKYDKPLRIDLHASVIYLRLLRYSHLLSLFFVIYLISLKWWTVLLLLPLLYSYKGAQKSYIDNRRYVVLQLHADGRFLGYTRDGSHQSGVQIEQVVFLSPLVILTLCRGNKKEYLLLFTDAMTKADWHQLQLFLRMALQPITKA